MLRNLYKNILVLVFLGTQQFLFAQETTVERVNFNSRDAEFSPTFFSDGIVFISNRKTDAMTANIDANGDFTSDLYYSIFEDDKFKKAKLLSDELASKLNEGPACFNKEQDVVYYTRNIKPNNKKGDQVLGILISTLSEEGWSNPKSFLFNSRENEFDVAHPSLSADGTLLYFASNMPGGYGGFDLYYCKRINEGQWSEPINLGKDINTPKNEGYPFIAKNNRLYFSSQGFSENKGMDILYSNKDLDGYWQIPILMEAPINSNKNDYSLIIDSTGRKGYFTSDRNKIFKDDIFEFQLNFPEFNNCNKNYEPALCYLIEDNNIELHEDLPLVFEWNLGTGDIIKGYSVEYCFPGYGSYDISLSMKDTITNQVFAEVSQVVVEIEKQPYHHITCPDTVSVFETITYTSDQFDHLPFIVGEVYWDFGGFESLKGKEVDFIFNTPGNYRITVGVEGEIDPENQRICVYKDILVVNDDILARIKNEDRLKDIDAYALRNMTVLDVDNLREADYLINDKSLVMDSTLYFVQIKESVDQIPLNDEFFLKTDQEITERYRDNDNAYIYSIGKVYEISKLYPLYKELQDSGYVDAVVREDITSDFIQETTKRGYYMSDSAKKEMSAKINTFANILFTNDSYEILAQSHGNLNKIIDLMISEPNAKLEISAHTDNTGSDDYNLDLSQKRAQAVMDYFISNGVEKERLYAFGFGQKKPIFPNTTEEGKAKNRRVEFQVVSEEIVDSSEPTP